MQASVNQLVRGLLSEVFEQSIHNYRMQTNRESPSSGVPVHCHEGETACAVFCILVVFHVQHGSICPIVVCSLSYQQFQRF